MRNNKTSYLFFPAATIILAIACISCTPRPQQFVSQNSMRLAYMGRIDHTDSASIFYWPGTSVTINFTGTGIQALLKDEKGKNYYNAIIDSTTIVKLSTDSIKHLYTIASGLRPGRHSVQLYKITEADKGKTWFYGFGLQEHDTILAPAPPQTRKIEFYGNSITCGYALEDVTGDSKEPKYENNYRSYAAITARHYNAAYHCIAKSGIGLMLSWFHIIMPEMYDRINPEDTASKWDFSKYTPNVVIINLCQNDSWLVNKPDHAQFKARFGTTPPDEEHIVNSYKDFVLTIRSKYPDATIICLLGSMDITKEGSPWPAYIEKAVALTNDQKILTHFFPYKNTPGHPKAAEQEAMAQSLISFIDTHVKW